MKRFLPVDLDNCSVMTRDEVRAVDAWAIESLGIAGVVLMENAGSGCADIIAERLGEAAGKRVCIFCGGGNNGGDGYVIARHLRNAGCSVKVVICADRGKIKGDALENLRIIEKMQLDIEEVEPSGEMVGRAATGCDMVVDALLGTGLTGRLRDNYIEMIESINSLDAEIIAVDIPSGLDCDEGRPLGAAIRSAATVTFVAVKKGFIEKNAKEFIGDVYVVSIGIEPYCGQDADRTINQYKEKQKMKIIADTNIPFVKECFSSIGDVTLVGGRDITAELVKDADILLVRSITKVNEELLGSSSVKFAATATIGMDHIDRGYLDRSGIGFSSAPGSNANSVAEYVVAALLALGKKYKFVLEGKSIGIVGVGNVGSKVAKKAASLGMKVVLNDPPLKRQTGDDKYRPLDEVLECDFVTMHTPLTIDGEDKTYHLADEKFFASMKTDSFFFNSSRGGVHDTAALKAVLDSKGIAGAVLDVWENEPDIDNELLLKVDLSTPHIAGYSYDGKVAGMIMIYEAACRHFGLEIKHTIDDFLPAPETPEISIDPSVDDEQAIIHDTVQSIYVINRDDFNTREILIVEPEGRGKWFDDLRKTYPVRREFQNTKIVIEDKESKLAKKLTGIGFRS